MNTKATLLKHNDAYKYVGYDMIGINYDDKIVDRILISSSMVNKNTLTRLEELAKTKPKYENIFGIKLPSSPTDVEENVTNQHN